MWTALVGLLAGCQAAPRPHTVRSATRNGALTGAVRLSTRHVRVGLVLHFVPVRDSGLGAAIACARPSARRTLYVSINFLAVSGSARTLWCERRERPPPRCVASAYPVGMKPAKEESPPRPPRLSPSVDHRSVGSPSVDSDSPISTANAERQLVSRAHCHWWVIDPRKVRWIAHWDLAMTLALVYVALVTPVEVAFMKAPPTLQSKTSSPIFLINRLLDAMFILDILLNFRLAYKEE